MNSSYEKLGYPNGDVPLERGVCADVVVRGFRKAGVDLQKEVHEDMSRHFDAYPKKWGATKPDPNILIVHNIGAGARIEDVLMSWKIIGHYRMWK